MKNQFSDIYNLVFILVLPLQFIIFCEIKLLLSHSSIQKKSGQRQKECRWEAQKRYRHEKSKWKIRNTQKRKIKPA